MAVDADSTTADASREPAQQRMPGRSPLCPQSQDQARDSLWRTRVATVVIHVVYVGALFLVDSEFRRMLIEKPLYIGSYLVVLVATLAQYFFTSGSSPGYVVDAMRIENGRRTTFINTSLFSQQSSSKNEKSDTPMSQNLLEGLTSGTPSTSWFMVVSELYPPGTTSRDWICNTCKLIQPPRAKHCVDCDKCVLQFDHHCMWLGTCIGQRNHRRFWWYLLAQTILCLWTAIFYCSFLRSQIEKAWWEDFIMITLLASLLFILIFLLLLLIFHSYLALTNQTTYEMARKKRIHYMKDLPGGVHPFSKGIYRNLLKKCCTFDYIYDLEAIPSHEEIEAQAKPYTFIDVISCRCC